MRQVPCTPCSAALEAEMAQRTTVAGVPDERSIEMLASQVCHKHANVCSTTQYPNRVFNPDSRNIVLVSCGVGCFKGLFFFANAGFIVFCIDVFMPLDTSPKVELGSVNKYQLTLYLKVPKYKYTARNTVAQYDPKPDSKDHGPHFEPSVKNAHPYIYTQTH